MVVRYLCGAGTAMILTFGLAAIGPTNAQGLLPPEESGEITVAGCLQFGGTHGDKYVLASPRVGTVANLPADTCRASVDGSALELEHASRHGIDDSMVGRFIEVSGRLERETHGGPDNLRELSVRSFKVAGIAPAREWTRDASLLPPEESGVITVAGCLRAGPNHGDEDGYVLASPRLGPIGGVPESTCTAAVDDRAIELDHSLKRGINDGMLGRWIEVTGRLEKETSQNPDNLREMYVSSFRMVPVIPRRTEAAPVIEPPLQYEQPAAPPADTMARMEEPTATAGVQTLPKTASPLPAIGLLGLLSLSGGLFLRLFRSYERA
jgi:hypothetical protein